MSLHTHHKAEACQTHWIHEQHLGANYPDEPAKIARVPAIPAAHVAIRVILADMLMTESACSCSILLVRIGQHQPIYSLCDKDMLLVLLKLDIMSKIVFGSDLHSPPITTLHYMHRDTFDVACCACHHGCFPDALASHNASKPSSADDLQES